MPRTSFGTPPGPASGSQERQSQRERQRAETRERLYQAALAEFRSVGSSQAQIPRIATAAGVVRGTFYFHFPSREHVLIEALRRAEAEIAAALRALQGRRVDFASVLDALIDGVLRFEQEVGDPDLFRDILATYIRAPLDESGQSDQSGHPESLDMRVVDELATLIALAAARGELRSDVDADQLAGIALTSFFGVIAVSPHPDQDRSLAFELLKDVLQNGMRPGSETRAVE